MRYFYKKSHLKSILNDQQLSITIRRLAHQILENHPGLDNTVIIGLQPRGVFLSDQVVQAIRQEFPGTQVVYGRLDITFYRDDIRKEIHVPNRTEIPFSVEGKKVVLIDDVLYTGRTIRAAMDALIDFGRPEKVELCVLIDRRYSRQFPIQADYTGRIVDAFETQKVKVRWKEKDGASEVVISE